ncbi:MAG: AraC family transcriptional regulator [Parvularculaceae bacterium]|nr:AraC family transcriptional regulator [Parvularculaceae bacterium]
MSGDILVIDLLLRGANFGASLLLALCFLSRRPLTWRHGVGAAFALGTGCYLLVSSNAFWAAAGAFAWPAQVLSIVAPVLFWWFALALFDDGFRMRWPYLIPLVVAAQVVAMHFFAARESIVWRLSLAAAHSSMALVYGHTIFTALRFFNDDLIEGRRRFRIVFAIAVAFVGLAITTVESLFFRVPNSAPVGLQLFQAGGILTLTLGFAVWLLGMREDVLDGPKQRAAPAPQVETSDAAPALRAADRPAYEKLTALMAEGAWKEDGLTVAGLAAKVGVPEHQLRALINGQLGFRNFSAFLSAYRLEAARRVLADPAQARRQVLQIALDVGYGSIAPFNRAFKDATGQTPTEFRKAALGEA